MRFVTHVLLVVFVASAVFFQVQYDRKNDLFHAADKHLVLPSAMAVRIASFGHINLAADLIYIWAIQFLATESIKNRYQYSVEIFDLITDLNPKFEDPYYVGSVIIGLNKKDPKNAIRILQKARKYFKEDYMYDYDSAYFAWYYLKDYQLAKKYYLQMSQYPGVPNVLKYFWINMDMKIAKKTPDLKKAFQMWQQIEKVARGRTQKEKAKAHLLQLKYKMDKKVFDQYIQYFKKRYHRYPMTLVEMKRKLKIRRLPRDYLGNPYLYDPMAGRIDIKMEASWKKFL